MYEQQSAVDAITLVFRPSGPHQYSVKIHIIHYSITQVHMYTIAQLTLDTHLHFTEADGCKLPTMNSFAGMHYTVWCIPAELLFWQLH